MEKLTIESKRIVEQAVNTAVKQVKQWTKKELQSLLDRQKKQDNRPLIVSINNNLYLVGNYAIGYANNQWYMIYRYNDKELVFVNKNAALFYAVCNQTHAYQLAGQLLLYDQNINRLTVEGDRLKYRLQQALKKKNRMLIDLYASRYRETLFQLKQRQHLLEKTLKLAKYCNH